MASSIQTSLGTFTAGAMSLTEIVRRLKSQYPRKILLSVVLSAAFYGGYFSLQRWPLFPPRLIGAGALDRAIPFDPRWVPVYLSLIFFIPIAPWLMDSKEQVEDYCLALLAIMFIGFGIFFLWPTRCSRPPLAEGAGLLIRSLRGVDSDLNACPSLHAAFALYSALLCNQLFKSMGDRGWVRALFWLWTGLILFATLATKQHMSLDLFSGGCLGLVGYGLIYGALRASRQARGNPR